MYHICSPNQLFCIVLYKEVLFTTHATAIPGQLGWLAAWLPGWLAGWLLGTPSKVFAWLAGWLAGWMAGWLAVRCGSRDAIQGARERPENLRTFISWAFSWSSWAHPHVYVYICMPWGPQGCQSCHGCHMCPQYIQVCVCTTAFPEVAQSSPEQPRGAQVPVMPHVPPVHPGVCLHKGPRKYM